MTKTGGSIYSAMIRKVDEMVALMDAYRQSKGELLPSLDIGVNADRTHNTHLVKKYGPDYIRVEW